MSNISHLLAEKRKELGLSIDQVAEETKIRAKYLVAIEDNTVDNDLPPPVYMIGYIRNYADYLGFDASSIATRFKKETIDEGEIYSPETFTYKGKPSNVVLALSMFLALIIYVGWYKINDHGEASQIISETLVTEQQTNANSLLQYSNNNANQILAVDREVALLAKDKAHVKITNSKGDLVMEQDMKQGDIFFVKEEVGFVISADNYSALELLSDGRITKLHKSISIQKNY